MSHQLTNDFWDLLGLQGLFLCELFHKQSELVVQLQLANNALKEAMQAQDDVTDAVVKAVSPGNTPTMSHSLQSTKAAKLESFNGSRDKMEQFVQAVCIPVTMQIDTFTNKRMNILYVLLFMCRGMAQV